MKAEVQCNHELFGEHKGEKHETSSLSDFGSLGEFYEITAAGCLELLECTFEDRSDRNATGWKRLRGAATPVFTGKRQDRRFHGWLEFPGFGRAKFTDGTLVAFEPESDRSHEQNRLLTENTPPRPEVQSSSAPALESTINVAGGGPAEYLRRFFSELERLKCRLICDVSYAIGFRDGKLYVLMSVGDFRERVYVEDLDKNPASAAQDVFLLWRTTPRVDKEIE